MQFRTLIVELDMHRHRGAAHRVEIHQQKVIAAGNAHVVGVCENAQVSQRMTLPFAIIRTIMLRR